MPLSIPFSTTLCGWVTFVVTHSQSIGETGIESGMEFALVVALIGKLGLFTGVVTHPQTIGGTRIETGMEFALVVALIRKLGLFNLDIAVDHVLLKQCAPTVVHGD